MSYRRALLFRWSTRDILAVLALAVIVAFLTGSALFYTAAKDKPTDIAQEFRAAGQVAEYSSVEQAQQAAGEKEIVLRVVELEESGRLLVGVDDATRRKAEQFDLNLPSAPPNGVGYVGAQETHETTIRSGEASTTVQVRPLQSTGLFPNRWYVSRPSVIDRIGPTGALVISPPSETLTRSKTGGSQSQTVLRSTLLFFERGTEQVLQGFALLVIAAGILGAVTIASVIQMTIRDRIQTILVIRATGGKPFSLLFLFGFRGLLLTAAAVALGYAVGVILSSVVTSIAVFAGLPTTITPRVTAEATRLLVFMYGPILLVGFTAAVIAVIPVVRRPPGRLTEPTGSNKQTGPIVQWFWSALPGVSRLQTQILDWRAVYPTIATVSVFAAIVLLVTAGSVVAEPLAASSSSTVLEPGAAHPVVSTVPESYASAFSDQNLAASPEVLIFGLVNGEPTIIRGGEYDSFAAVSDATLVQGRLSQSQSEAVIGVDFARTHSIDVGDTVVIGAGTQRTVERVRIVGAYQAPGAYDDQMLVSLDSARHLSAVEPGNVNFVRLSEGVQRAELDPSIRVVSISIEETPTTNGASVSASVVNIAETNQTRTVSMTLHDEQITKTVTAPPGGQQQITAQFNPDTPGNYTLTIGALTRQIEVRDPQALTISGVPGEAPPGSSPLIRVRTLAGEPVSNTTVSIENRTYYTDERGYVRPLLSTSGTHVVQASRGDYTANESIVVTASAKKRVQTALTVDPENASEFSQPTAQLRLYNPWNTTATGTIQVQSAENSFQEQYDIASGEQTNYSFALARLPAGEYSVTASINGTVVTETAYEVSGNNRLSTVVLRNTETTSGGGLGAAISIVFGNLTVVIAALVTLAGVMVSGALVASFARAIHARRRTLGVYRATGASPLTVVKIILRDTLLIGSVSVTVGLALGVVLIQSLAALDLLVFYGIRITPSFTIGTLLTVGAVALGLVLLGTLIPTVAVLKKAPAAAFSTVTRPTREEYHD